MTTSYNLLKYNLSEKEKLLEHISIKPGHRGPSGTGLMCDFEQNSYIYFLISKLAATNSSSSYN